MNVEQPENGGSLSPTQLIEINRICDRLEAQWRSGGRPAIEHHIGETPEPIRSTLLHELLATELECRRSAGERPDPAEYRARFPAHVSIVEAAFASHGGTRDSLDQIARDGANCELPYSADRRGNDETAPHIASGAGLAKYRAPGTSGGSARRYRVVRPHSQGGLGAVFVAVDAELNREVALKEILDHHAFDPMSRARFLLEAEITGGLEHPGIVPVYGLGSYADGRPYYAMRFIRGDSLKAAIAAFHSDAGLKSDSGRRALELSKLLRRFLDVCNAIDYAHSRGVLHRDIKPANVIVGKYGETLLVDWGLAKATGHAETSSSADEHMLRPTTASAVAATHAGAVLGTPAYMSPEQAGGDLERLGPHSDVYGLGATLFSVLTGRPPAATNGVLDALSAAREGRVTPPRELDPSIDRALEAVCLKALAKRPEDRYPTARTLADDLERWLADEPVSAWREPLPVRAQRWMRRHKTAMIGTAATIVAGMLGLAAVAAVQAQSNRALMKANGETSRALDAEKTAKHDTEAALVLSDQARRRAEAVLAFLKNDVLAATRPKGQAGGLDKDLTVRDAIDRAEPRIALAFKDQPIVEAEVRNTLGESAYLLGDVPMAVRQLERAVALRQTALGPDHLDTLVSRNNLAVAYRESDALDRAIPMLEQVVNIERAKLGQNDQNTLLAMNNLGGAYLKAGQLAHAIPLFEKVLEAQRATLGEDDLGTLGTKNNLALAYRDAGRFDRSILLYKQALEATRAKLAKDHPDSLTVMHNLALAYRSAGQLESAIPLFEQVREGYLATLDPDHPHTLTATVGLGGAYWAAGRPDHAIPLLEHALKGLRAKLGDDHTSTLVAVGNLAQAYESTGRVDRAISLHEHTVEALRQKLHNDHPLTLIARNNLALAYQNSGQVNRAIAMYEETLTIEQATRPKDHPSTLMTKYNLALACVAVSQLDRAISLHEQALEGRQVKLGADNPDTLKSMTGLAVAYAVSRRLERAIPLFEQVIKTQEAKLGAGHADTLTSIHLLATGFESVGRWSDAEPLRRELLARRRKVTPQKSPMLAVDLAMLGLDLLKLSRWPDAEALLGECLAIREQAIPDDWSRFNAMSLLGEALLGQGKYAAAEPLIVQGFEGMKSRGARIPPQGKPRLSEAAARVVRLYEAWGKPEKAERWKAKLGLADLPSDVFAHPASSN